MTLGKPKLDLERSKCQANCNILNSNAHLFPYLFNNDNHLNPLPVVDVEKGFPALGSAGKPWLDTTEELNNNYTDKTNFYRSTQVMAKEHINPKPLR